ncbi:4163f9c0-48bf-447b-a49d-36322ced6d22, partial [Thermothielavioides terrestris]
PGLERRADRVQDTRDDNRPAPAEPLVAGREHQGAADGAERHGRVDQAVLPRVQAQVPRQVQVRARDERLVQAGQQAAHGRERHDRPREVPRVAELEVERPLARVRAAAAATAAALPLRRRQRRLHLVHQRVHLPAACPRGRQRVLLVHRRYRRVPHGLLHPRLVGFGGGGRRCRGRGGLARHGEVSVLVAGVCVCVCGRDGGDVVVLFGGDCRTSKVMRRGGVVGEDKGKRVGICSHGLDPGCI